MGWLKNLSMVVVSILVSLLCFEIYLRVDGRYSHIADVPFTESNTIWTRSSNTVEKGSHPDLSITFDIVFDEYGARKSSKYQAPITIGYFGDSFTENRRLENQFSINEYLNELSPNSAHFNFGVDGYGMEQSAQRWFNRKDILPTDVVVYLFCANDLRNTYEVKIFDKEAAAKGELVNIVGRARLSDDVIRIVGRLHLTYLMMDGYFQLKGVLRDPATFKSKLVQKFIYVDNGYNARYHDDFADSIVRDLLSPEPSKQSIGILTHYKNVLGLWRDAVEQSGKTFIVAVIPRNIDRSLAKIVFDDDYEVMELARTSKYPVLSGYDFRFVNNGHWNEVGNLSAALSLAKYYQAKLGLELNEGIEDWTVQTLKSIEAYYDSHDSVPAKP